MATNEFWKKNFNRTGNCAVAWRVKAQELLNASDVLKRSYFAVNILQLKVGEPVPPEATLLGPMLMIRGNALECLLKATAIKRGKVLAINGRFQRVGSGNEHNLVKLASIVEFHLSNDERDVLECLSYFITAGRYPIQMNWNSNLHQPSTQGVGKVWHSKCGWRIPSDEIVLDTLVDRLFAESN